MSPWDVLATTVRIRDEALTECERLRTEIAKREAEIDRLRVALRSIWFHSHDNNEHIAAVCQEFECVTIRAALERPSMTRWEIVRAWNAVIAGWDAQANLSEEGVALTIEERLSEAGLGGECLGCRDGTPVHKGHGAVVISDDPDLRLAGAESQRKTS
jgi:uncharacterized protein YhaN